jgi:5,5'-dehydrodivanillate O-demethylase oxygenase subunit
MEQEKAIDFEHTGPGTPAGRLFRQFWQPVFRSSELKPGHAKYLKILGEDLALYRNEEGVARIIDGRCPHRGALLSGVPSGASRSQA